MSRLGATLLAVFFAALGFGAGYWFGFRDGTQLGVTLEFVPRAAISLHHINAIDAGKTKNTLIALESDIDTALVWTSHLDGNPLKALLEPLWDLPVSSNLKYLTRLADYRRHHPSPMRAEALALEPGDPSERGQAMRAWLLAGAKENDALIAAMIEKYGTRTP